jgi:CRISPR/Cas system-associated exonuclease Cas4 (RecB family)
MNQQVSQLWISNSKIVDFLKCPRSYYLKYEYRDLRTRNKIALINPHLALGGVVHDVLESLARLNCDVRFNNSLLGKYEAEWSKYSGELGGFTSAEQESVFKERGAVMIKRVMDHPGPLLNKALKLTSQDELPPRFLFSKKHNIFLSGKIDWIEYLPEDDSMHIIDFKTGKNEEDDESLQLPIYCLLVKNLKNRAIKKISYWYIERDNEPQELPMPDLINAQTKILDLALKIKETKRTRAYKCQRNGCFACLPLEAVVQGKCKFIGTKGYQDIYITQAID